MGRHSVSHIAAQQGLSSRSTAVGAAKYVGRVGALALAMGVGAALSGGAGLANADGATDNGPTSGGGDGVQASPELTAGTGEQSGVDSSPNGSAGVKARKPTLLTPPKMELGSGGPLTRHVSGRQERADVEPGSLPGLIAGIPQRLAALGSDGATGVSAPALEPTEPQGPAAPGRTEPLVRARGSARPTGGTNKASSTTTDDAVASFVREKTEDLVAAFRGDVQPLGALPPRADTSTQQRLTGSPVTTTTSQATGFAELAPAAEPSVAPRVARPIATLVSSFLSALGFSPSAASGDSPVAPMPIVLSALQLIRRELEHSFVHQVPSTDSFTTAENYANANPANAIGTPSPDDEVQTAYGDIGKWMLESNGDISDYGGQPYTGRTLLEPVNVIIVDPTSTSKAEATQRLNAAMFWSGFPAQPVHSTGFQGTIDDVTYGQQPTGLLSGYSDNLFILPNDHGRIFGPDPVETSSGYVWSGAFSTEQLGIYNLLPTHTYVSSDMARAALAMRLILSGQATFVAMVPLDNAVNTATTTTGDHDGYAVVLQLK